MQSGKLCIPNYLVRQLGNFTPHLGPAMCVFFTNPNLYLILSIIIDVWLSCYFAPIDTCENGKLESEHESPHMISYP